MDEVHSPDARADSTCNRRQSADISRQASQPSHSWTRRSGRAVRPAIAARCSALGAVTGWCRPSFGSRPVAAGGNGCSPPVSVLKNDPMLPGSAPASPRPDLHDGALHRAEPALPYRALHVARRIRRSVNQWPPAAPASNPDRAPIPGRPRSAGSAPRQPPAPGRSRSCENWH